MGLEAGRTCPQKFGTVGAVRLPFVLIRRCANVGVPLSNNHWVPIGNNQPRRKSVMKKYRCVVCGYIYDREEHHNGPFEELPADWSCPSCGAGKDEFEEII